MRRRASRSSDGQVQLEYVALLLLVAGIVGALILTPIPSRIADGIRAAVCKVVGGQNCGTTEPIARRPHKYYQPEKCMVSKSKDTYGGSVSVAFIEVGMDVTFIRQEFSNGKVRLTAMGSNSVGAVTGIGAEVSFGKVLNAGAEVEASAGLKIQAGDTWVFDSPKAADRFIENYRATYVQEAVANSNPVFNAIDWAWDGITGGPDITEPTITRQSISLKVAANGNAGLGVEVPGIVSNDQRAPRGGGDDGSGSDPDSGSDGDASGADGSSGDSQNDGNNNDPHAQDERPVVSPGLEAGAGVNATGKVIVSHNHKTGERSVTYKLGGGAEAGVSYIVGNSDVNASVTGAMRITRNKNGQVVSVRFTRATTVNGETSIVRTELAVDNPRQRKIVTRWLGSNNDAATTAQLTWDSMVPTERPAPQASPFQRLMYREAEATKTTYSSSTNAQQIGAEVKYGLVLGAEVHHLSKSLNVESSEYLGAPRDGSRGYVTYEECHA